MASGRKCGPKKLEAKGAVGAVGPWQHEARRRWLRAGRQAVVSGPRLPPPCLPPGRAPWQPEAQAS